MGSGAIIDKTFVSKLISMADWLYRKGVVDCSHLIYDEGLIREWLEKMEEPRAYGYLEERVRVMSSDEWATRLMLKARQTCWNGAMCNYLNKMGRFGQSYLSVFIPCSMQFYLKGVKDYLNAPLAADINIFLERTRKEWTSRGLKKIKQRTYVDQVMLICYDLKARDSEFAEAHTPAQRRKQGVLPAYYYDSFIRAVGLIGMRLEY